MTITTATAAVLGWLIGHFTWSTAVNIHHHYRKDTP